MEEQVTSVAPIEGGIVVLTTEAKLYALEIDSGTNTERWVEVATPCPGNTVSVKQAREAS